MAKPCNIHPATKNYEPSVAKFAIIKPLKGKNNFINYIFFAHNIYVHRKITPTGVSYVYYLNFKGSCFWLQA
jgi:hypothetical protein